MYSLSLSLDPNLSYDCVVVVAAVARLVFLLLFLLLLFLSYAANSKPRQDQNSLRG